MNEELHGRLSQRGWSQENRVGDQKNAALKKIGYLSGPINGEEAIGAWYGHTALPYLGTVYLHGFCDVVKDLGAQGVVITYRSTSDSHSNVGDFAVYNIRRSRRHGILYHLSAMWRMLKSYHILYRERVDCVVITEGANYWFTASLLRMVGIEVIASLHCRLWSPFEPIRRSHRILRKLNAALFFKRQSNPFMGVSEEVGRQVAEIAYPSIPIYNRFYPTYSQSTFSNISPPPIAKDPFVIFCASRVEVDKGVLDLVEMAARLRDGGHSVLVHICGDGSAMRLLKCAVRDRDLSATVIVHGACDQSKLLSLLSSSHVVVVPTRTEFEEGFAKTCAEGVLAGRPVITSRVCPALEDISEAAVEVEPNDVASYANAVIKLMSDKDFYNKKQSATREVSQKFLETGRSYSTVLLRSLRAVEARKSSTVLPASGRNMR